MCTSTIARMDLYSITTVFSIQSITAICMCLGSCGILAGLCVCNVNPRPARARSPHPRRARACKSNDTTYKNNTVYRCSCEARTYLIKYKYLQDTTLCHKCVIILSPVRTRATKMCNNSSRCLWSPVKQCLGGVCVQGRPSAAAGVPLMHCCTPIIENSFCCEVYVNATVPPDNSNVHVYKTIL